jgi:hypothetical protein
MNERVTDFIGHSARFDPAASEKEIENASLEAQYEKLTDYEKDLVFAKINGYRFLPITCDQMVDDEFYLGGEKFFDHGTKLFDFWRKTLNEEIYQGRFFTKKPYIILSGAIGIGKSTATRLLMSMTLMKLLSMKSPYRTLGIVEKPLSFLVAHRKEESAILETKDWLLKEVLYYSPFFKTTKPNFRYKIITSGPLGSMGIGNDLIFSTLGELSFWPNQESAKEKAISTVIRFKSRLSNEQLRLVGHFVVDSSSRSEQDAGAWIVDNVDKKLAFVCSPAHYEVRPNMYKESKGQTFRVFIGDGGSTPPQIIPKDAEMDPTKYDPDRVIKVPIQLLGEFKANLIKSLQDLAGVSTGSNNLFFEGDITCIKNCSTIINKIPEVITVDFYDKNDRLIDKIKPMLSLLRMKRTIFLGGDLSAARGGDATGLSGVTFEGWKDVGGTKMPMMKCWFMVAIKNKGGQELSLFHIEQFINDLNKLYRVVFSADQAFSKSALQFCERENIATNGRISTDIVPCEPAIYLKYILKQGLIQLPENLRFQREAADLYYTEKGKIDHPKKASTILDNKAGTEKGSKDTWDSLCQSVYSCKLSLDKDEAFESFDKEMKLLDKMTEGNAREQSRQVIQSMIEDIF